MYSSEPPPSDPEDEELCSCGFRPHAGVRRRGLHLAPPPRGVRHQALGGGGRPSPQGCFCCAFAHGGRRRLHPGWPPAPIPTSPPGHLWPACAPRKILIFLLSSAIQESLSVDEATGNFLAVDGNGNKVILTLEAQEKKYLDACNVTSPQTPCPAVPAPCLLVSPPPISSMPPEFPGRHSGGRRLCSPCDRYAPPLCVRDGQAVLGA